MPTLDRTRDTFSVLRGIGARGLGQAVARRAVATARALGRAAQSLGRPPAPATSPQFVEALRAAPSPLAARPAVDRRAVWWRAHAALTRGAAPLPDEDVRLAWEQGRGRRIVQIAAGLAVRPDDRELRAGFEYKLCEFLETHRPTPGVDPLEAALRSWALLCVASMAGPRLLGDKAASALAAAFVEHARHILPRLEDRGLVVGSHLAGELMGLYACGVALQAAGEEPASWRRLARAGLAHVAAEQVLVDGGGAEGSTGYARFVAELLVAASACARAAGEPMPEVEAAAERLLAWLVATVAPDGLDLAIGDDDDSRVLPGARPLGAHDLTVLAPLVPAARREGMGWSEIAGWLLGEEGKARWEATPAGPWPARFESWAFGVFLARRGGIDGDLVTLRAGNHGQLGAGGHAHNDALALSIWFGGHPAIVDPGTGLYLGRRALRDRFRGVAAHAAVCIDGLEPSPILASRPFALPDRALARVVSIDDRAGCWRIIAQHEGYRRVGVTHRREVRWLRDDGVVTVTDELLGRGSHDVAINFPLASADAPVTLATGERDREMPTFRHDPGLVSPEYGSLESSVVARRMGRVQLPVTLTTILTRR